MKETATPDASVQEGIADAGNTNTFSAMQATGKQLVAIVFILALAAKMFLLPIFLIRATGRDGYIALAVDGGLDLVALAMLLAAIKLSDMNIFELTELALGKTFARIFAGAVGLFLLFKLNLAIAETLAFYDDSVFTDFDVYVMAAVLLVFMAAVGTHTLRSLCRLNELLVPLIVVCVFVLGAIVIMTGFDLANIFPAMRDGRSFCGGLFRHSVWLGDFTPLIMFIGRTKTKKHTHIFAAAAGVTGTAVAVFFALVLCAAFGNVPDLVDTGTNLSSILQFSLGNVYGKIDMFSSVLWSISSIIGAALFFYAAARCLGYAICVRSHFAVSVGICAVVYAVQVFALSDPTLFTAVTTNAASSVIAMVFTFATPLTAMVCVAINKNRAAKKQQGGIHDGKKQAARV